MAKKVILCAGPSRSGSTWQYNIIRLLTKAAYGESYGAWVLDYDPANPAPVHVIKIHDPKHLGKLVPTAIVTGHRDLRDVLVSARRMKWRGFATRAEIAVFLDRYVRWFAAWQKKATHAMRYEDMMADPFKEAIRTSRALRLGLDSKQVRKVCQAVATLEPPRESPTGKLRDADPDTQLHPGHIGHGSAPLDEDSRRFVERRYSAWLLKHGYEIGDRKRTTAAKPRAAVKARAPKKGHRAARA